MEILRLDSIVDGVRTTHLAACVGDAGFLNFLGTVELLCLQSSWSEGLKPRRSACIRQLFVHPSFRRQNIGRELVEMCCEISLAFGCETLGLSLGAKNRDALAFYKKLGFSFAYEYDDGSGLICKNLSAPSIPQSAI